jgi:alpha-beta hydrolase superfamily lysophospholipase
MNHQEGFFTGADDKQIYYQAWLPEGDPKAVLLVVHGLAEHSGRYLNVVNYFTPLGYAVYALDHIGHGKSEGDRVYVNRFEDFTRTVKIFFDMIREWQPEKPIFIVGHSMGGLISSFYLLDHQDDLAGAILSGAGVKIPDYVTPATITMGKILSKLLPKVGLIGLEAEHICSNPAVVQAYVNDPLVYTGKSSARLGAEMLKAMQRVTDEASTITLPITIVHGSDDKLIEPEASQMLYDKVSSEDKTLKIYPGYYHEVFNETGRDVVFGDLHEWLEAHLV